MEICALSTWFGRGDGTNLSTVPGMVVLGRSEILAVSKLSSAILADFDMRGSAISVWTASIGLLGSFLGLLLFMIHSVIRQLQFPDDPNNQADHHQGPK